MARFATGTGSTGSFGSRPNRRWAAHFALAVFVGLAALQSRGTAAIVQAADTAAPFLVHFDFAPKTVDVSATAKNVTFTAEISDGAGGTGLGVDGSYASYSSADSTQSFFVRFDAAHRVSGTAQSGSYQFVQTMQAHAAAGNWTGYVRLLDGAGNSRTYTNAQLTAGGFPSMLTVVSASTDTSPPQLAALDFTPKIVDVSTSSATITVTARLVDSPAGAGTYVQQSQPSTVLFKSPSGQIVDAIFDSAHPYSGTPQDGQYRESMTIKAHSEAGTWAVYDVLLIDKLLNQTHLTGAQVAAMGFPTTFTVISGAADTTPPTLVGFSITPRTVDTSTADQTITLTAHITDDISGVLEGPGLVSQLNFRSPSGNRLLGATFSTRASGTHTDGVYTYPARLAMGSEQGTWTLSHFRLSDEAGNGSELTTAQVAALGFPTTFTNGPVVAPTATPTVSATVTRTPTQAPTSTATSTPGSSQVATGTSTASASTTITPAVTQTKTVTPTPTSSPTSTASTAATPTRPPSSTPTERPTPPQTGEDEQGQAARTIMVVGLALAFVSIVAAAAIVAAKGRPRA